MLLSDLRPLIRLQAPGCPDPLIDIVLVEATRQFCRATHVWRVELESGDLSKEAATITLTPPEGAEILTVYAVEYGSGGRLDPQTSAQLSRASATWRDDEGTAPTCYVYTPPATLRVYPRVTGLVLSDLIVTVALMPALGATELDDRIATPYSEVIRLTTLGELLVMPNKPWTSQALGGTYLQMAAASISNIVEEGTDNGVRNLPRRVRYGGY